MRKIVLLLVAALAVSYAHAQKDKYTKLFDAYTMEKYEKCIDAALGYTESEKTAKDPEPYLYISMSYFEMSKDPDRFDAKKKPEYKDPLKKAVNYASKLAKRDKDGSVRADNKDFMEELKEATMDAIKAGYENKETSKYVALSRDFAKAYDKDYAVMMFTGMYLIYGNAQSDGLKYMDVSTENLKKNGKPSEGYDRLSKRALTESFVKYSQYLNDNKDKKKAMAVIDLGKELLPESEEIQKQAEALK